MNIDHLTLPKYTYINCLGHYLHGSYNYYAPKQDQNEILHFINNLNLQYVDLNSQHVKKSKKSNNPWHFQIVSLFYQNKHINHYNWYDQIYHFLDQHFNFHVQKKEKIPKNDFENIIQNQLSNNKSIILGVDEYYNPLRKTYFNSCHNRHSILLVQQDQQNSKIIIVDDDNSEKIYSLPINFIKKMYYSDFSFQEFLIISCNSFVNNININQSILTYLKTEKNTSYINSLIYFYNDLNSHMDINYCLTGLNCSIISKIQIMTSMRYHLYKQVQKLLDLNNPNFVTNPMQLSNLWWAILRLNNEIINKNIYLTDIKMKIIKKLELILDLENENLLQESQIFSSL